MKLEEVLKMLTAGKPKTAVVDHLSILSRNKIPAFIYLIEENGADRVEGNYPDPPSYVNKFNL